MLVAAGTYIDTVKSQCSGALGRKNVHSVYSVVHVKLHGLTVQSPNPTCGCPQQEYCLIGLISLIGLIGLSSEYSPSSLYCLSC